MKRDQENPRLVSQLKETNNAYVFLGLLKSTFVAPQVVQNRVPIHLLVSILADVKIPVVRRFLKSKAEHVSVDADLGAEKQSVIEIRVLCRSNLRK